MPLTALANALEHFAHTAWKTTVHRIVEAKTHSGRGSQTLVAATSRRYNDARRAIQIWPFKKS
jgi:hypothetical protein